MSQKEAATKIQKLYRGKMSRAECKFMNPAQYQPLFMKFFEFNRKKEQVICKVCTMHGKAVSLEFTLVKGNEKKVIVDLEAIGKTIEVQDLKNKVEKVIKKSDIKNFSDLEEAFQTERAKKILTA
jgi:ATP phosphoribosyltransferase